MDFDCRVRRLYKSLVEDSRGQQDIAFREQKDALATEVVLDTVCNEFRVDREYLSRRQRGCMIRPVAAQMLCKFAGMNQRAVEQISEKLDKESGS